MFPVVEDVIERHGMTTEYHPLGVLTPAQRPDLLVGVMTDWEALVFSSRPIVNEWTPARNRLSQRREEISKAKAAYRELAKRAGIAVGDLPNIAPSDVYVRDGHTCQLCGTAVEKDTPGTHPSSATLHYLTPVQSSGQYDMSNVVTAHRRCNRRRAA